MKVRISWLRGADITSLAIAFFVVASCSSRPSDPKPVLQDTYYIPAWSPDGTEIACIISRPSDSSEGTAFISILDAETGMVRREREMTGPPPFNFAWTPDGQWLLFGAGPGIFKMSADLALVVQLTSGQFHGSPSFSRAKNVIFFCINGGTEGGLWSVTLEGDSLRRWSDQETLVLGAHSFPDSSDSLIGYKLSSSSFSLSVFIPDSLSRAGSLGVNSIVLGPARASRDHNFIAFNDVLTGSSTRALLLLDRRMRSSRIVTESLTEGMDFSPDGSKLLYPRLSGLIGLWIYDIVTGEQSRLTGNDAR